MVTKTTIDVFTADDGTQHDTLEGAEEHERIASLSVAALRFATERHTRSPNPRAITRTVNLVIEWERWQDAQVLASLTDTPDEPEAA